MQNRQYNPIFLAEIALLKLTNHAKRNTKLGYPVTKCNQTFDIVKAFDFFFFLIYYFP